MTKEELTIRNQMVEGFMAQIRDLEAQVNSLSNIMARQENELAEKDREISRLQKMLISGKTSVKNTLYDEGV